MGNSFSFLLQATRVLHVGNYDDEELKMIYGFISSLDNVTLNEYYSNCTLLTYYNDLELYIEIVEELINIYEEREEYEKCMELKNKKNESIKIMQN
jgi:hypothetical protein